MSKRFPLLILCYLSFCSCGVLEPLVPEVKKEQADIQLPEHWITRFDDGTDAHQWVKRFGDPLLVDVVNEALRNNNNLSVTALRVSQFRTSQKSINRSQLPSFSGSVGASNTGSVDDFSDNNSTSFSSSSGSTWEPDLWGRLKNVRERAQFVTQREKANYFAARLSLAANTTRAYFDLVSARNSLTLAEDTLENFKKSLRIIERNYKAGVPGVDALDVQFGRNNVTRAERTLSSSKLTLTNRAQSLELLLGRYPSGVIEAHHTLPKPLKSLPSTLPSGMIEQRPDLISARANLLSRAKTIDINQKALFPSFSLTGRVSSSASGSLSELLDVNNIVARLATSISHPLFDNGRRKLNVEQAKDQYKESLHSYAQSALVAFREVEFALQSEKSLQEQMTLLRKEVKVTTLAEKQAQRDYSEGLENARILSVLEAQRRAVNARSSLISIRNQRLKNQVDVFVSIGGNP